MVAEPRLLLFDEPLSNLDADLRERLRVEISTLTRDCGATAVYITHDQSEAFALADRIGILDRGHLVQLAAPEDVYHRPATPFVARFTGLAGEMSGRGHPAGRPVPGGPGGSRHRARPAHGRRGPRGLRAHSRATSRDSAVSRGRIGWRRAGDRNTLSGVVTDVAYRGRGYDHVVDCAGAGTLSSVHSAEAHGRGERVEVHLDPEGCLAYRQDETPNQRHMEELTVVRVDSVA